MRGTTSTWLLVVLGGLMAALILAAPGMCALASMPRGANDILKLRKKLRTRMTPKEVSSIAGDPDKVLENGDALQWFYNDVYGKGSLSVAFYNERVMDIQMSHLDLPAKN